METYREFDIAEVEWGTERVERGGLSIFSGTIEVEKCNVPHVHDSRRRGEDR
jgi:hypothetical protein